MKKLINLMILLNIGLLSGQQASVTNVSAGQRTDGSKIVDVYYDLAEDVVFTYFHVGLEVSFDDGANYQPIRFISGDAGNGVMAGTGKHIEWNLGAEFGGMYNEQTRVKVIATGRFVEVNFDFVVVPAGDFTFGSDDETRNLSYNFEIMKYEVTNAQYAEFLINLQKNGDCQIDGNQVRGFYSGDEHYGPGDYLLIEMYNDRIRWNGTTFIVEEGWGKFPVVGVTWFGAWKFADYYLLRLPTEEEWEKTARGNTGWEYPWGESIDNTRANYSNSGDPYDNGLTPVGFFDGGLHDGFQTTDSYSPFGAYDMAGNVTEWTSNWGYGNLSNRIFKGGAWRWGDYECRVWWYGDWWMSWDHSDHLGFRCARTVSTARANYLLERQQDYPGTLRK
ncbi:MAG: formylglycine-generating enzyme family protein [Candidatus Neomarinimicrobiota bacterium]